MLEHMYNPDEFYGKVPFATLSADDPNYDPNGGYWLGGVWAPTNYAAISGLKAAGYSELAREAAIRYLDAICAVYNDPAYGNTIWECYSPDFPKPGTNKAESYSRKDFCGWSALGPISLLMENVIGVREIAALDNRIVWDPGIKEGRLGIRNLRFGDGTVDLVREADGTLNIRTDKPFTLVYCGKEMQIEAK